MDIRVQHEVAQYIQASQALIEKQANQINRLTNLLTQVEGAFNQKEAAQQVVVKSGINADSADKLANAVIEAGFLKEANRKGFISAAMTDNAYLGTFLEKLAENTVNKKGLPSLGSIDKQASPTTATVQGSKDSDVNWDQSMARLRQKLNN
jgi:hypothetical protein